ncbi:glycosyltransferase family 4 protein [Pararhizobium antarcticum]|uniref:Glycosyl transferase n=1 Tax=Pararhizobium antarcticum TaxID=1798805 RepID=A0A657LZD4_9HYPH|nr:glycosyltransferase family 4 protein [Pararhizobium antarcticum]OJF92529.1 glycosyl transferase [Rhizobium sp. 58]OJG00784.1 glycosyl transferase [Pararhizobium antarcticum]
MTSDVLPIATPTSVPMRILQVLEPSGGGSGRHFLDLCRGLAARGHHVEVVYSPLRAEEAFLRELKAIGLPAIHSVAMKRAPGRSDIAAHKALGKIIRNGGFDIVHGHSSKAGALTRLRLPGPHVPRIYTPHAFRTMDPTLGLAGRLIYGSIELLLARLFTDHLICVSDDEYDHARRLGIAQRMMSVIRNGVTAPQAAMAQTLRASFGIAADQLVFGFIGRLSPQKAPERLLQAFAHAASRLGNAHLVMVGSGELEGQTKAAIQASGLQNRIHLTSVFSGPQAVSCFDVLVMPSRYEAMSYVMLEAAAAGKPIISTDIGGARTVIADGMNGLIVPNTDDITRLSAAMATAAQPETFIALQAAATARKGDYSLAVMIDKTESLYRKIAQRT